MTPRERVIAALDFRPADYVPLYDQYWGGFVARWRARHRLPILDNLTPDDIVSEDGALRQYYHVDIHKVLPVEDPWPTHIQELRRNSNCSFLRDGWGRVVRRAATSPYGEPITVRLAEKSPLDTLEFESPQLDQRYAPMLDQIANAQRIMRDPYIFIKIGGPYLRSSFLRGEMQWYMDIAEDPGFASALAGRVADHLIAVGVEALRRSRLTDTSVWIFDDVAANRGPLLSPAMYEEIFLPLIRRMVVAFRQAGARHVGFHSDGDIRPLLDGLVDAGIAILHPLEPRAGMDVVALRSRYGRRVAFVGGLCNSHILTFGTDHEVRRHVAHVLSIVENGGLGVGSHTISNDISPDRYSFLMKLLHEYAGRPLPGPFRDC